MHRKPYKRSKEVQKERNAEHRHQIAEEFRDEFIRKAANESIWTLADKWKEYRKEKGER